MTPRARAGTAVAVFLVACIADRVPFDPAKPAAGPGSLVGNKGPVSDGAFVGEGTDDPAAMPNVTAQTSELTTCDAACQSYCGGLGLQNPIDAALCPALWGVGLDTRPIDGAQACRRLFGDLLGRFPTRDEVASRCEGKTWGAVARDLIADPAFVALNQRRWADALLYNNQAVSVTRIFDADELVGKLYRGQVAYDEFAAVASAHPVLTRRKATPGDRAEALFNIFLGRPPFEGERADMARLYTLWENGYYDHPALGMRLPDAVIRYRCVGADGKPSADSRGDCTSTTWGHNELILTPDVRATMGQMWSGLLRPEEWAQLTLPGRVIAKQPGFWEHAASEVMRQYLGYDLGIRVPAVREKLIEYVLRYGGDIRALHHAVATSQVYLQASTGETPTAQPWTYGPLKQVEVETWIDTIKHATGHAMSQCDHRVPQPGRLLEDGSISAIALIANTRWTLNKDQKDVAQDYANLARTLGGCPENEVGGRFKTISILTTATQQSFVTKVCNPGNEDSGGGIPIAKLLPGGIDAKSALDPEVGAQIFAHQTALFLGRDATADELDEARATANACGPKPCTAEQFARPACYALLTSSELLFY